MGWQADDLKFGHIKEAAVSREGVQYPEQYKFPHGFSDGPAMNQAALWNASIASPGINSWHAHNTVIPEQGYLQVSLDMAFWHTSWGAPSMT
jgi:hypothetical protein